MEAFKGSGAWDEALVTQEVPVAEVAIIICDMWDKHWCEGATARCDALADRMAPVIKAAIRDKAVITGNFSQKEVDEIVKALESDLKKK